MDKTNSTDSPDQSATIIKLVVIDDDLLVCDSLRTILGAQPDIEVAAIGSNGSEAIELYRTHQPDILLTDIQMPGHSGLDAAETILSQWPNARIVLLTTFSDDEYIVKALTLGAKGYLIKKDVATIAPALRLVMSGQSVLGNEVLGRMDKLMHVEKPGASPHDSVQFAAESPLAMLTSREFEVTELVARGLDNKEIAATLYISEGTARNLISAILQKLDLKNRTQLAVLYYREI
ncbi:MAG: response regulator transcription factor [Coriobacteriales bacterium]|jgi:DNA-binding NarL/FixJ family response regulator|nr:response regulator transcription factor [Coriobacteriales bacterium]